MMNKDDLHDQHPDLIPPDPDIFVRDEWLPLIDEFFSTVIEIYGDTRPSVRLHAAYDDDDGGLVIDLDDTPWTGNQDPALKQRVRTLVRDFHKRSRDRE
ncbi:hypothetical protein ELI15_13990 [Rhizobium ruizarguesonis]|uniref:hypothetical protein n=1 Tax=Rhizobium ruizarguesonis TaxID=2081791 RepID=UPI001030B6C5|nr:hypothetical protein [Rhizobium ruizarguesonis]TAW65400.1 hypothetical protein ELI15_13990 [Rhizobium ruizarguesonis]